MRLRCHAHAIDLYFDVITTQHNHIDYSLANNSQVIAELTFTHLVDIIQFDLK